MASPRGCYSQTNVILFDKKYVSILPQNLIRYLCAIDISLQPPHNQLSYEGDTTLLAAMPPKLAHIAVLCFILQLNGISRLYCISPNKRSMHVVIAGGPVEYYRGFSAIFGHC